MVYKKYRLYTLEELKNKYKDRLQIEKGFQGTVSVKGTNHFEFISNLGEKIELAFVSNCSKEEKEYVDYKGTSYYSPYIKFEKEEEELE